MNRFLAIGCALVFAALTGCASMWPQSQSMQRATLVDYLYPDGDAEAMTPTITELRLPLRVGVGFVPSRSGALATAAQREALLERVRGAFVHHDFIADIQPIPDGYMRPAGGFANLDQVARMLDVQVVALLSYDQVQFNDSNRLSVLYWTIIGAYLFNGDEYDVSTLVDASVFDVTSRKLLFRAPGSSQIKGSSPMVRFSEASREARDAGFTKAVDAMVPALEREIESFRERIKSDSSVRVVHSPGYRGGGAFGLADVLVVLAGLVLAGVTRARR